MRARVLHRFNQLRHNMRWRGRIRIAHAKVNNILGCRARLGLGRRLWDGAIRRIGEVGRRYFLVNCAVQRSPTKTRFEWPVVLKRSYRNLANADKESLLEF